MGCLSITIAGIGYVGLANAVLLAQRHEVCLIDVLQERVDAINSKRSPIDDAELELWFREKELSLYATTKPENAFKEAQCIFIATPTDYDPESSSFNTSSIEKVIETALEYNKNAVFIIRSTVPVGYTDNLVFKYPEASFLFSPEFLREGQALRDCLEPSRIIVGVPGERSDLRLYAEQVLAMFKIAAEAADVPTMIMGASEAEAVKLFANAYLAARVAFFNELDTYVEACELNAQQIIDGVSLDPRIGKYYNNPSFGYGGYCLPKDTKQLMANFKDIPNSLITGIVQANRERKEFIAQQILRHSPKSVGIYRLEMKSGSNSFRQPAVLDIIGIIKEAGAELIIYEPSLRRSSFQGIKLTNSLNEFKQKSDIIVANRYSSEDLGDVNEKVYTRDIYSRD